MAKPSNDSGRVRRRPRRLLRRLLITALVLGVVVLVLLMAVQTPFAKQRIARFIENNVSSSIIDKVEIGEITGTIPFNFRISEIALWDEGEPWLIVHDVAVHLARRPLLQRRVHVRGASSELVELLALPVGEERDEPWRLPERPDLPRWLRIDRAVINELRVSDAVAAEAGRFTVNAQFIPDPASEDIDIQAHLERIDAATTHADVLVVLAENSLTLRADASDSVFLPELLNVEETFSLHIEGSGPLSEWDGTLEARLGDSVLAQAVATLRAETDTIFDSRGSVNLLPELFSEVIRDRVGAQVQFAVDGTLSDAGLLQLREARVESDQAVVLASGTTHLDQHTLAGELTVRHADLREFVNAQPADPVPIEAIAQIDGTWTQQGWTLSADVSGDPSVALEGNTTIETVLALNASGEIRVPKVLVAEEQRELTDEPVAVAVNASYDQSTGALSVPEFDVGNQWASIDGSVNAIPAENTITARVQMRLADSTLLNEFLAAEFAGTGTADIRIDGTEAGTTGYLHADFTNFRWDDVEIPRITVQADVDAGAWPDDLLAEMNGELQASTGEIYADGRELPPVRLALVADQDQGEAVRISQLRLTDDRFVLAVEGIIAENGDRAEMAVNFDIPELSHYTALIDQPYDAAIDASADVTYDASRTVPWQGTMQVNVQEPGGLPDVVEALLNPATDLSADFGFDGDRLSLANLAAASKGWRLGGEGAYAMADQAFDARAQLELSGLEAANTRSSGTINLAANGTTEEFEANADVRLVNLEFSEFGMDSLNGAVLVAGGLEELQVTTQFTAETAGEQLTADAVARYAGSDVDVSELAVRSGANTIDGQIQWNLDAQDGQGSLALDIPEMDQIGRVLGEEIQGQMNGEIVLAASQGGSTLNIDLAIRNFSSQFASLDEADIDGTVQDLFNEPTGSITAEIESLIATPTKADFVTLTADFEGDRIQVDTTAAGLVQETIPFETTAQAAWRIDESVGELVSLQGTFEEYRFALQSPTEVRITDQGVVLEPTTITFGDGVIEARASVIDEALEANAEWTAVPLAAGRLVGLPFSQGTLAGTISLTGSPDQPVGLAMIDIADARTPLMEAQGDISAEIHVESELTPNALMLTATLEVPQDARADLNLTLPLTPSDETVYALDETSPWSGALTANMDLAMVPRLLALEAHVLQGRATADFTLAGSLSDPALAGGLSVAAASYENSEFGTILRDIHADLRASGDQVELAQFRANDPTGGTVTAKGQVRFADLTTFDHDFAINFANARLVHRDDLTGRIEGDLAVTGDQEASEISGDVDVIEANVILRPAPDRAIPELAVTTVNAPASYQEERDELSRTPLYPIRLDIDVTMPGRVFVQAADVFTEWDGTVHVGGTLDNPYYTGQIAPVRGYIAFLGQRFGLQRESSIRVDTREMPSPILNLVAVTTRDDVTATLYLRGPLEELSIEITSVPALPREEILARILFGRDMTQISPVQALQLARAVAMFSGTLEGVPFFSGPSRLPVIDTFDIETGGEAGPTVSVGKYLREDIFVELEQGATAETGRAKVEFEVTPHISVESTVGANTEGGVGLFWKYDY